MGTIILDLDGTCLRFHTNEWLPGVVEKLTAQAAAGHQIVFISMRGWRDPNEVWNGPATEALLKALPFENTFIPNSTWPRLVIDDYPPGALHTETNSADWIGKF